MHEDDNLRTASWVRLPENIRKKRFNIRLFAVQNHSASPTLIRRSSLAIALLTLIAASLGMAVIAVLRYPSFLIQPGARLYCFELVCALLIYAVGIVLVPRTHSPQRDAILNAGMLFGALTGILEVVNIGMEIGIPFFMSGPRMALGFMLVVFTLWGVAAYRTTRSLGSAGAGLLAAVSSACICMLIAVTVGFAGQFFLAPPDPAQILTWAEYRRSGWTDPRAFGLANTFESGLTHLVVAPIVATLFGGLGTIIARLKNSNSTSDGAEADGAGACGKMEVEAEVDPRTTGKKQFSSGPSNER